MSNPPSLVRERISPFVSTMQCANKIYFLPLKLIKNPRKKIEKEIKLTGGSPPCQASIFSQPLYPIKNR
jgi:hypothetical protein